MMQAPDQRSGAPAPIPRAKRVAFALAAIVLAMLVSGAALIAIDVRLHSKYEKSAGFNIWGYRGPRAGSKQRDEYRVAVLGGSSAYGYGVDWQDAIPAQLQQKLAGRRAGSFQRFSVLNLGYNNEGAYSFRYTLDDYLSLDYDVAILYEGYNDMMADPQRPNVAVFRHDSPVFRLTGYLPIFPIIFREKSAALLYGNTNELYKFERKTVFRPDVASRTVAESLRFAADVSDQLSKQLDRVTAEPERRVTDVASTGCKPPWPEYCRSILVATEYALQHDRQVMFVTQPYELDALGDRHRQQQGEAAGMLARKFGNDHRVRYVNLGSTVDLRDKALSFDHMHLTAPGNARIADALVQPVLDMAAARDESRQQGRNKR
jgi:hypothetical protein